MDLREMTPTLLLTLLLGFFGNTVPDVQPAVQPFYNDILQGFDSFDNLSRYRLNGQYYQITEDDTDFQFTWVFQGDTVEGFQPAFNEFTWTCDGSFTIELICYHVPSTAKFSRFIDVYANWSALNLPSCGDNCPFCVSDIWQKYEPYEHQTSLAVWDCNGDNHANTADLLCVLEWSAPPPASIQPPDPFEDFVPFKVQFCGEWYYNASPEMIDVMGSHVGDYIPPLDMTGDGWITTGDVIELLTYQGTFFWSPNTDCIDYTNGFLNGCGAFPPQAGCTGQQYLVDSFGWVDWGLIGELSCNTQNHEWVWYFAK